MEVVYIIIGLILGFSVGYLLAVNKSKSLNKEELNKLNESLKISEEEKIKLTAQLENSDKEIDKLNKEISEWKEKYDSKSLDLEISTKKLIATEKDLENLKDKLETQKLEIEELQDKFKKEFENLANKIFEEKSEKFVNINKDNLSDILQPFKEQIEKFEKKVEETYDYESRQRASLQGEITKLYELSSKLNEEAANLTKALKGDVKQMGNWGEMILERILEESGLVKNREYFKQESLISEDGKRYQPDFVVKLPENRNIIIDSKVSLIAYEKYVNADNQDEQKRYLDEHIKSIKSHIEGLTKKNYQDLYGLSSIDYVFMFIPIEPAFLVAIQKDSTLWQYAYNKKILLISPTNLIAVLKITEKIWQQEYQNQNAFEIAKQGADLYDKFKGFIDDLLKIGDNLSKAQASYEAAMNKLSEGRGNLISKVEKLKKLGISPKKQLPKEFIDEEN